MPSIRQVMAAGLNPNIMFEDETTYVGATYIGARGPRAYVLASVRRKHSAWNIWRRRRAPMLVFSTTGETTEHRRLKPGGQH